MMTDFVSVYDNVLSNNDCKEFIDYIDQLEDHGLMLQTDAPRHSVDQKGINFVHHYDLSCWSWIGEKFFLYDVKAKKIPAGGGFHKWHYENASMATLSRYLVLQLYLNTIEEGGETEFLYLNKRVSSEAGRLVIFPAGFTHTHRGNPPINQTKYLLTSWALLQSQGE